ncbi:hypothetical protein CONLIGDRAFT_375383 [Coniochaeta ligniaria NRRL 30616]|uniref:Uncharacterized protein n=1 Tax=Coniochaeta ligniaria NRRL 30616 TaxID=1408157 RepID=A0A1J7IMD5_9PEZI|nr:hypothetical protein CONLIGDRAFT_375383 [Coniochaeta ligniaria NRRL 30616]
MLHKARACMCSASLHCPPTTLGPGRARRCSLFAVVKPHQGLTISLGVNCTRGPAFFCRCRVALRGRPTGDGDSSLPLLSRWYWRPSR